MPVAAWDVARRGMSCIESFAKEEWKEFKRASGTAQTDLSMDRLKGAPRRDVLADWDDNFDAVLDRKSH